MMPPESTMKPMTSMEPTLMPSSEETMEPTMMPSSEETMKPTMMPSSEETMETDEETEEYSSEAIPSKETMETTEEPLESVESPCVPNQCRWAHFNPVCGADGQYYKNKCSAQCANTENYHLNIF